MGNMCTSCCQGSTSYEDLTPDDLNERRKKQVEAAERRIAEQEQRGIKNVEAVRRQKQLALEREKREQEAAASTDTKLKWQMN